MNFLIPEAFAQTTVQAAPPRMDFLTLLPIAGMIAVFYFLVIRPQRKRQKEHANMVASLAKGDEVVTTSGILGKVLKVEEDFLVLQVADNVELKFQKVSVHAVLPKGTLKSI